MNTAMLETLIPIIAIVATFGFPCVLVYLFKFFKLKEKELQIDAELRKTAGQALEARVQRLESVLLALDADLRSKLGAMPQRPELMEAPPQPEPGQADDIFAPSAKVR